MREEQTTLNGQTFHIRHWGEGNPRKILMLHGFPEYGGSWTELAERLSAEFHCIAPDQRGYGQSWAPAEVQQYTTSALVGDMAALLGDTPVTVLGHDWGAAVAYGLAMFRPDLTEKLIIMNGVHPVPFQRAMAAGGAQSEASQYINYLRRDGSEDRLSANDFEGLLKLFSAKMDLSWMTGETLERYKREWRRPGRLKAMINWYRASPLKVADPGQPVTDLPAFPLDKLMVRCPHLLVWGMDDTALLPVSTDGLEEVAPDLTRVEIAGADHWLHHQKPDDVARAIMEWLR